jgi:hypothetical protein
MANLLCMGLFLALPELPSPRGRDCADDGLASGVHMDVLDRHLSIGYSENLPAERSRSRSAPCDADSIVLGLKHAVLNIPPRRILRNMRARATE